MSDVRVHVQVPEDIHRQAKAAAASTGRTLKQFVIDGLCHEIGWAEGNEQPDWSPALRAELDDYKARQPAPKKRDVEPRFKG